LELSKEKAAIIRGVRAAVDGGSRAGEGTFLSSGNAPAIRQRDNDRTGGSMSVIKVTYFVKVIIPKRISNCGATPLASYWHLTAN
jgi:hypothetical protein